MDQPTPKQFQTVIDTLKSVLPKAQLEGHLDMGEHRVSYCDEYEETYPCGTVHCVAGWYAIAAGLHTEGDCDYYDGAEMMTKQLGFKRPFELREWAYDNPAIWGNRCGDSMFINSHAWSGAATLADCVKHLEGVRDRLVAVSA